MKFPKTLLFEFCLKEDYENGEDMPVKEIKLFEIENFGAYYITAKKHSYGGEHNGIEEISLHFEWADNTNTPIVALVPEILGGVPYQFMLTTDMDKKATIYINGVHHLLPDCTIFNINFSGDFTPKFTSDASISNIYIMDEYIEQTRIKDYFKSDFFQKNTRFLGTLNNTAAINFDSFKGDEIYNNPISSAEDISRWKIDAGILSFENGCLKMESKCPLDADLNKGHMTIWCDFVMPSDFIVQYDFKIIKSDLCIVFFSAHGVDGIDMFDSSMPLRRGEFYHYIKGKIKSYHISYHASGRGRSNCRKNNKFYLLSTGDFSVEDNEIFHTLTLIKTGNHIRCFVDDHQITDVIDDDEKRYGAFYKEGRMGLRQMKKGIALYRNLKIWNIKGEASSEI